jgi:hypothetical protein
MAVVPLTDAFILIGATTLSDHGNSVTISDERDQKEITAFGASNKAYVKGLGDASIDMTLWQDFAAGKTHQTLQPLLGSNNPTTIEVRPSSAARSTTNPAAVLSALLTTYQMLDGGVGDPPEIKATFINGSQTGLQYLTA